MLNPRITMACVVHCQDKFLFVEEFEYGKMTLNQPAGHLEENETLLEGAKRELFEETGIEADMQALLGVYQWHAPRSGKDYFRFVFIVELDECVEPHPHDSDISGALWLTVNEFQHYIAQEGNAARNPLVWQTVQDYLAGKRYPLTVLQSFNFQ